MASRVSWSSATKTGVEGSPIALGSISGSWTTLTISGIPTGAVLSDGSHTFSATAQGNNSAVVTGWNVSRLSITPADDANFTLTATTDGGQTASEPVVVKPLAPTLAPVAASGIGGQAVPLDLGLKLGGAAGDSNSLVSLIVSGIPVGAVLSDGTHSFTAASGSRQVDIHSWSLGTLAITPANSNSFSLKIAATEQDAEGNPSTVTRATEVVTVTRPPVVVLPVAKTGVEGTATALDLGVTVNGAPGSASNLTSLTVGGIPVGAALSDGTNTFTGTAGSQQVDVHTWNLTKLTITPANDGNISLNVAAKPIGTGTATRGTETVTVTPLAPTVVPVAASGLAGQPIPLTLGVTVNSQPGETNRLATLAVGGIPVGAKLSDGTALHTFTAAPGSQSVDVHAWNLTKLTITPPTGAASSFSLTVAATEQDARGDLSTTTTASEPVTVTPTGAVAVVAPVAKSGVEGGPISLDLGVTVNGAPASASNLASLMVSGIPAGATLSDGTTSVAISGPSQSVDVHTWNLAKLTITPVSDANFTVGVAATATGSTTATTGSEAVTVNAPAPTVVPLAASGAQGTPIALTLGATATGKPGDANTLATLTVSGIPTGAVLTDGTNSFTGGSGTQPVDIHAWSLTKLTITPPANGTSFSLTVAATEQDAEGNLSTTTTASEAVTVTPAAATVVVAPVAESGVEGAAIPLDLGVTVNGAPASASNLASLMVSGIPAGATLSDGTTSVAISGPSQSVDVHTWNLAKLTITPVGDANFTVGVAATATGSTTATTGSEAVTVTPLAPTVVPLAASGAQGMPIALTLGATATGKPGDANTLATLTVSGIPTGAVLTDGTNSFTGGSGTQPVDIHAWSLTKLTITPPANGTSFSLTVAATEQDAEGNLSTTTTASEAVTVTVAAGRTISTSIAGPVVLATGDNPLTITSTGRVTSSGAGADGVDGPAGPAWTITNNGVVTSAAAAGILLASGGSVTNAVGASISGNSTGVDVTHGIATVSNAGGITGTTHYGVTLDGGGSVTNTGSIIGFEDGVRIQATAGTVINSGTITGIFDDGIGMFAGGVVSNAAGGLISATGAAGAAIFVAGGAGTVTNSGSIVDPARAGIRLDLGGTITNNALATIAVYSNGIDTIGAPATVTNSGSINATGTLSSSGIYIESTGAVTNTATGKVTSNTFGVFLEGGFTTFANYGTVFGAQDGVVVGRGGAITNAAGASITAGSTGVYSKYRNPGTVTNAGIISATGTGAAGIDLADGGAATNVAGGTISGKNYGVFVAKAPGVVKNSGTITSQLYGAVQLLAGGSVTNDLGALLSGGSKGADVTGDGTITNNGSIGAAGATGAGAYLGSGGVVTNSATGSISGTSFGVFVLSGAAAVTNNGLITGAHGVALKGGGSLTNAATILGGVAGVYSETAAVTVTNSGTMTASSAGGAGADIAAGGTVTNLAAGSLSGTTYGVFVSGGPGTVVNAGAISGGTYSVKFSGSGTNRLVVNPGGTFSGPVGGASSATNILELAGGTGAISGLATDSGTVTANGSTWSFLHFNTLDVDPGGSWTVNGSNAIASVLNDGTIGVAGSLAVTTAVDPASDGVFQLNSGAAIDIASALGANAKMQFLGSSTALVDDFQKFGLNVGTSSYVGPQLEDFGVGDSIDLKNFLFAPITDPPSFNSATGVLQLSNASSQLASLSFQTSSLGSGSFHAKSDGSTGTILTLS